MGLQWKSRRFLRKYTESEHSNEDDEVGRLEGHEAPKGAEDEGEDEGEDGERLRGKGKTKEEKEEDLIIKKSDLFRYNWFHRKGTWSVHSFNGDYLHIYPWGHR